MLIEILKEIILDFQEQSLPTGVPRRLVHETVPRKAFVLIGVRRCGKSTFLFQIIERLVEHDVDRQNILYINFFDDRLHDLRHGGLAQVLDAYYSLYPQKKGTEKVYCFFDEIQMVKDWEPFVDRILRTENCEVYLTGSSAKMLSKEIATQMRGRSLSWELFPFSFQEYLDSRGITEKRLTTKTRLSIQNAYQEYWEKGGFPEVLNASDTIRVMIHQEYFKTILHRDIIERHDVNHPQAVLDLAYRLMDNVASLHSINSLTGYLKSLNHRVSKTFVRSCLDWFEDAFFLFSVRIFDASRSRQNVNPRKIYCIDHALVPSVSSGLLVNAGHLLENLVFLGLRRNVGTTHYYRTRSGKEVDFIWKDEDRRFHLVQVCETLREEKTRKREITALADAMQEQNLDRATLVTRHESETVEVESGVIDVLPAWEFLFRA